MLSSKKQMVRSFSHIKQQLEDVRQMASLFQESDMQALEELKMEVAALESMVLRWEMKAMFSSPYDVHDAILSIHAGTGGTDACDWAEMLLRMYLQFLNKMGFSHRMVDQSPGEEAGIKSATVLVNGEYAYGNLKAEKGVHRLVRLSPFDANHRRHTSFAAVDVVPQLEEEELVLREEDLRIETFRASGAGGQHVNKTSSAVRITHIPTGIVVQCQNERSQHRNKAAALKVLKGRLFAIMQQQKKEKLEEIRGYPKEIAWGNQIRSYVLHPYQMVKDHRTGLEVHQVEDVLGGEILPFIKAYLQKQASVETSRS